MVRNGTLQRIGRVMFNLPDKPFFAMGVSNLVLEVSKNMKAHFPLVGFCLWDMESIRSFAHHLPARSFLIVEVEKAGRESVYDELKDKFEYVYYAEDSELAFKYLRIEKRIIFVKNLLTESPLQSMHGVPMRVLEKILVDVYCYKSLFGFIKCSEWEKLWETALSRYSINSTRLLRYAVRRGQKKLFFRSPRLGEMNMIDADIFNAGNK